MLIINADDYGADREATENTIRAFQAGTITSASVMVFMEDTGFAAEQARDLGMETGLHLNYTVPFTGPGIDLELVEAQAKISSFLRCGRFAQLLYNPFLVRYFRKSFQAQYEEYLRLFHHHPSHIDGHHHMHLCVNSLFGCAYPDSIWIRRSFTFKPGEKGLVKWLVRKFLDRILRRKFRITDFFYSIEPIDDTSRLEEIFRAATDSLVELETHPARGEELELLLSREFRVLLGEVRLTGFLNI